MSRSRYFIVVHGGAGYHAVENERHHRAAVERAIVLGAEVLSASGSALDAGATAGMSIEDDPICNAGYGSNLTEDGVNENDATVVDHQGRFGGVCALTHVKNPTQVAKLLLKNSDERDLLNRLPPNLVAGHGAVKLADRLGIPLVPLQSMISPGSLARFRLWIDELQQAQQAGADLQQLVLANPQHLIPALQYQDHRLQHLESERELVTHHVADHMNELPQEILSSTLHPEVCHSDIVAATEASVLDNITDTIGWIVMDDQGHLACGSSSGGIGLKVQGRVGPAALNGVSSYVMPRLPGDAKERQVAVVVSGSGEHIGIAMVACLAAQRLWDSQYRNEEGRLVDCYDSDILSNFITHEFNNHPGVKAQAVVTGKPVIGILAVRTSVDGTALYWAYSSSSFVFGAQASDWAKPESAVFRKEGRAKVTTGCRRIFGGPRPVSV